MDLYLSPPVIHPYNNVELSDTAFGKLHKYLSPHLYKNASIKEFIPLMPWETPAAFFSSIDNITFPSIQDMDNEFDQWQSKSTNPFTYFEEIEVHFKDATIHAHMDRTDHSTHQHPAK